MITATDSSITYQKRTDTWVKSTLQVLGASILLALVSQIAIPLPFTPIFISMQTLAVFMIGLTLGSKKAPAAVVAYLAQGTLGLPVFAGAIAKPLWFMAPGAGYLMGFIAAAWIIGKLSEQKEHSFSKTVAFLVLAEASILVPGSLWLSYFVGFSNAISLGVVPFLVGDILKLATVAAIAPKAKN